MADIKEKHTVDNAMETNSTSDQTTLGPGAIPEDLNQQLKNVGARVRMSVSQGYRTAPSESSINFRKAQSTGYIFRSANDALRDAYRDAQSLNTNQAEPLKKRSRSVDRDGSDVPMQDDSKETTQGVPSIQATQPFATRAIKPLRTSSQRALLQTRSMPVGALAFSQPGPATIPKPQPVEEEEDWSEETTFAPVEQPFQPMEL